MQKEVERYWVAVAAKDHIQRGVAGGFVQVNHGKQAPLKRLSPGDWVIFYSPKQSLAGTDKCQSFTAVGQVRDEAIYQVAITDDFVPYRRDVVFQPANDVSILPLIDELDFIQNKKSWGYTFRFGFFEIDQKDFDLIRTHMQS